MKPLTFRTGTLDYAREDGVNFGSRSGESIATLTDLSLPGSKRCAQLFLFVLAIFLKPNYVRR